MFASSNKSIVWEYFKKAKNKTATCGLCNRVLKYLGSTSSLRQHLIRIHHIQMQQERRTIQPQLENVSKNSSVVSSTNNQPVHYQTHIDSGPSTNWPGMHLIKNESNCEFEEEESKLYGAATDELSESKINEIHTHLLKMIVLDFQPLSIVENIGFLEFSAKLNPLYKPPTRKELTKEILQKAYADSAVNLKMNLNDVKNMSITTDVWMSENNIGYLTVTCHYIKDYKLFSRVLGTKDLALLSGYPTAQNLSQAIITVLNDWNVYDKIKTIVTDNEASIISAVNDILKIRHHPCVAHTLNLKISEALKGNPIHNILNKCRSLVGYFKSSILATEKLRSTQLQMSNPILNVKRDVATRWNSCFYMLERLLKIKDSLCIAMESLPNAPEILDANEWKIIEDCVKVLKPAENMSTILLAEKYPTLSLIIPLFCCFQHSLKHIIPETEIGEWLKSVLLDVVTPKLGGYNGSKIAAIATFLDPRFKKFAFETEDDRNNAQKWVTDELSDLLLSKNSSVITPESIIEPTVSYNSDNIWAHFDSKISYTKTHSTPSMEILMVMQYLDLPPLDRKQDPLEWWRKCKNVLPEMYELATKYLSIPATSVPSDRVFSKAGGLTCLSRNRISSSNVDKVIFLNSHFQ